MSAPKLRACSSPSPLVALVEAEDERKAWEGSLRSCSGAKWAKSRSVTTKAPRPRRDAKSSGGIFSGRFAFVASSLRAGRTASDGMAH